MQHASQSAFWREATKWCSADRNDDKREMKSCTATQKQSFSLFKKLSGSLSACVLNSSDKSFPNNLLTAKNGERKDNLRFWPVIQFWPTGLICFWVFYKNGLIWFWGFFACVCCGVFVLYCLQLGIPRAPATQKPVLLKVIGLAFAFPICETSIKQ